MVKVKFNFFGDRSVGCSWGGGLGFEFKLDSLPELRFGL